MRQHILIASVGLVLPVVTETLWALMNPPKSSRGERRRPVVPTIVHIVTTLNLSKGDAEHSRRKTLLFQKISELYQQFGQSPPEFHFDAVPDPQSPNGYLRDVRDEHENVVYANYITGLVRRYASAPNTVIHMSLAGGRKTMSSYDHSAMMFFGRVDDDMSHVLVKPAILERAGETFWWPDQPEKLISIPTSGNEEKVATSSEAVSIELVPVPFVRLGVRLPSGIPPEAEDYRELIEFIEFERTGGVFVVDAETLMISFGNRKAKLTRTYFALFAVFAIARKLGWRGAGSSEEGVGPNASGFLFLNDLRAGLKGDAKNPIPNDTLALRCFRALMNDDRFQHGLEGTRLLTKIAQSRIDSKGRVVRDGKKFDSKGEEVRDVKTVDYTSTYRANLARQLKTEVRSPYTLQYLMPETWETEDGRMVIGLNVRPDRIALKGFEPFQLVEG